MSARREPPQTMLDYALQYAAKGWAVLPVHSTANGGCTCLKRDKCDRKGKHPRTRHGAADATTNVAKIKRWKWETANVGIATGEASGIVVLDIDPRNGGDDSRRALEGELGKLPECPTVKTGGGGWHLFFKYPAVKLRQPAKGIDIKADGGFVVGPPSVHVSGGKHTWLVSPAEIELPELPNSWLTRLSGGVLQGVQGRECLPGLPRATRATKGIQDTGCGSENKFSDPSAAVWKKIDELIQKTQPKEPGQRHRGILNLARGFKFMPELNGCPLDDLKPYVRRWHDLALPKIVNCREFQEEWWDFRETYEYANVPLEATFMTIIQKRAAERKQPAVAERYENPQVRQLVAFCREAQRERGEEPFFLSSCAVAEMFDIEQRRAYRWLKGLCFDGVLELVERGSRRKANTYRYIEAMDDDGVAAGGS